MPYEFGDVVLVRFPFSNLTAFKQRPAVVVSNLRYNTARPDVIIMAITSQLRPLPGLGEAWIGEWQAANLQKPSAIKPVFATVEQNLLLKQLGIQHPVDQASLRQAIGSVGLVRRIGNHSSVPGVYPSSEQLRHP